MATTQTYRIANAEDLFMPYEEALAKIQNAHSGVPALPLSDSSNGGPGFSYKPDSLLSDPLGFGGNGGNLGDANSPRRTEWWNILTEMNLAIQRAGSIYDNASPEVLQQYYPEFLEEGLFNDANDFETNSLESVRGLSRANIEKFMYNEYSSPNYTVRNIIYLYQALLGDLSYNPFVGYDGQGLPTERFAPTDGALLRWSPNRASDLLFVVNRELDLREEAAQQFESTQQYILESVGINYQQNDIDHILGNEQYSRFFSTTFDSDTISLIPLIYNFYLTSQYFQGVNKAFETPKNRVLSILLSTIANDNNFDATPDLTRQAADSAIASSTGQDQNDAFNTAARDFILKMLIKTPIDILKGVVELTDPHVAISKNIKIGTGFAFNTLAQVMDTAEIPDALNEAIAALLPGTEPNLNGEDVTKLILCLADYAMQKSISETADLLVAPPDDDSPSPPENFFPRMSIDGVDFTGTISGMLMIPPSPLGIIYLLLELLKNDINNQTDNVVDASAENANANECNDVEEVGVEEN